MRASVPGGLGATVEGTTIDDVGGCGFTAAVELPQADNASASVTSTPLDVGATHTECRIMRHLGESDRQFGRATRLLLNPLQHERRPRPEEHLDHPGGGPIDAASKHERRTRLDLDRKRRTPVPPLSNPDRVLA